MRKLGHEAVTNRLRNESKVALSFLDRENVSIEELVAAIESIRRNIASSGRREAETKELLRLLGNRKRLRRFSQAVKGRGPRTSALVGLIACRFGLSVNQIRDIASEIPHLHVAGLRRPRETLTVLALIRLSQFLIDRTGSRPQYNHLVGLVNAAFPEFGKIKANTSQKRLEKIPPEPWMEIPPLHNLGGDRQDRRVWVLTLMQQAARDILPQELDNLHEPARQRRKSENARRIAVQEHEAMRQREGNARKAWEAFSNFARRNLTSGEQKQIEPIIKKGGGWGVVERQWKSWDDAKDTWVELWEQNEISWAPIIDTLK